MRWRLASGLILLAPTWLGCASFGGRSAQEVEGVGSFADLEARGAFGRRAWEPVPILARTGAEIVALDVVGDTVYAIDGDRLVHALDLEGGTHRWVVQLDRFPDRPVDVGGGHVAFVSRNHLTLVTVDAGIVELRRALDFTPSSRLALTEETGYAGAWGDGGRLRSFSLADGWNGWFFQTGSPIVSKPLLVGRGAERRVVFATQGGDVIAVEARPSTAVGPKEPAWTTRLLGPVTADLVSDGVSVFAAGEDEALYALRADTGEIRWKWLGADAPLDRAPLLAGDLLLQPFGGKVAAIDAATGSERWRVAGVEDVVTRMGDRVVLRTGSGALSVVDAANGREIDRVALPLFRIVPRCDAGALVFSDGASVYALR